jgi:hypothetical protein
MDQLFFARSLQYYKRREVQEAILRHATDREVSPRYGEGFGKRPDVLSYPTDVLEFAKRKTTSFHVSEERWENPLSIKTGGSRNDLNALRKGWDLVLDIDAKNWDISRLTAWLFIEALKYHNIKTISCKFSGNKGWHVGVPFESFPETILADNGKDLLIKDLFPELPRAIAAYLLDFMSKHLIRIDQDKIIFGWKEPTGNLSTRTITYTLAQFGEMAEKQPYELLESFCPACNKIVSQDDVYRLICTNPSCGEPDLKKYTHEEKESLDLRELQCAKCKKMREFLQLTKKTCSHNTSQYERRFKLGEVIQIDTVLLASRHLYRAAYSLHEKSGLASVVIDPENVLDFDKAAADPKIISFDKTFLDISSVAHGEAMGLALLSWQFQQAKEESKPMRLTELEVAQEALGEEHFPPCIKKILEGMMDGKKRAMFALTNFFGVAGWNNDMIEKRLEEWNKINPEPLREVILKGHMHQVRMKKEKILPPNCKSFYQELGVCKPDEFCSRIKNPGQYALRHSMLGKKPKKRNTGDAPVQLEDL